MQQGMKDGWLGADAAYSIPQSNRQSIWIFGDTLYGTHRIVSGSSPAVVHNTIGVSSCDRDGQWKIRYSIRKDEHGNAASFFQPANPDHWYWAMDGFRSGSDLWITLLCVRASKDASPFGFETCGSDLAQIKTPGDDPLTWKIAYLPLVPDGVGSYPSAATVVSNGYAYIFSDNEKQPRPLVVTRIPLKLLEHPAENLEYLADTSNWLHGFNPEHAQQIMRAGTTELSIRYHADQRKWVAIMFEPEALSRKILYRTAPNLTGPWTSGKVIYEVPEMNPASQGYDKDTFCYAAKEHPEFEHGDMLFTYVCNTMAFSKLALETNIYFPRTVRMPMPSE